MPPRERGKNKKTQIDFSQSVQTLAQSNPDAESWFEEGVAQEGQGERYQSGPKAARHYSNASTSYKVSAFLHPTFKSHYNSARVDLIRAEEAPAPLCTELLDTSIASFRLALNLETASVSTGGSSEDLCDGNFNLASALVTLGEMIEDGARDGESTQGDYLTLYWEAHELFKRVEEMQMKEMDKSGLNRSRGSSVETSSDITSVSDDGGESIQAREGITIVPPMVIDTILERVSNEMHLYHISLAGGASLDVASKGANIAADLSLALDRIATIRQRIPSTQDNADQDLQCELTYLDIVTTCATSIISTSAYSRSSADVTAVYRRLVQNHPNNPDLLSQFGDHLLEVIDKGIPTTDVEPEVVSPILQDALSMFTKSYSILSDRMRRPSSVPAHTVPSLLANNLVSQSNAHLILYHTLHASPSTTNGGESIAALEMAQKLVLDAINLSNSGIKLDALEGGRIITSTPVGRVEAVHNQLEWRTAKAFREAFLTLLRVRMRMGVEGPGVMLLQRLMGRDTKRDIERFVEEIKGDYIWELTKGQEEQSWRALVA